MRKHSPRKWLHAILDLLPVILIPLFMIYSHRHDLTERTQVDIQYKYQSNEVNSASDLIIGNVYHINLSEVTFDNVIDFSESDMSFTMNFINIDYYDFSTYDIEFSDSVYSCEASYGILSCQISAYYNDSYFDVYLTYNDDGSYFSQFHTTSLDNDTFSLEGDFIFVDYYHTSIIDYSYFSKSDFLVIESVDVNDTKQDVMSVFINDLYHVTDTYFNVGNVFNLESVYNWFVTNIFNGSVPLVVPIVYHIIVYEFIMDLLFLLYSVFMFIIDFAEKLMDSFFDKSFGGGK